MKLIAGWNKAWKLTSIQIQAFLAAIAIIEASWAPLSKVVPEKYHAWIVAAFAIAGIIARLWPQPKATAEIEAAARKTALEKAIEEEKDSADLPNRSGE